MFPSNAFGYYITLPVMVSLESVSHAAFHHRISSRQYATLRQSVSPLYRYTWNAPRKLSLGSSSTCSSCLAIPLKPTNYLRKTPIHNHSVIGLQLVTRQWFRRNFAFWSLGVRIERGGLTFWRTKAYRNDQRKMICLVNIIIIPV